MGQGEVGQGEVGQGEVGQGEVGQGEVGGATAVADRAWRLLQLAIEKTRSALDGPLFCFLVQLWLTMHGGCCSWL